MKLRNFYRIIATILLIGLTVPVWGQGDAVFGPRHYIRETGKPVVHQDNFPSAPGEDLLLRVRNGGAIDKATQVSSATILLNGVQVVGPEDFNKEVEWIEKPVNLQSTNTIAVTLDSKPGSYITITIIGGTAGPSVSMNASPANIELGESSTLSWTSANGDSAIIGNGIGVVPLNGSLVVSPTETTTYTITVTGAGGKATAAATVTVTIPKPIVTLAATPADITLGESATLTWTSADAETVSISPTIGTVGLNGSTTVSPTATTTYTITATGLGGTSTTTATVTVYYPPPTVTIYAFPPSIQVGQTSTLTWSSTEADSASIDQGVGSVPLDGTITVTPSQDTLYTITVTGPGGSVSESVWVTISPLTFAITSPVDGAIVTSPTIDVKGTIVNPSGAETGVVVNGVIALIEGNQFTAYNVPVQEGATTIQAQAMDKDNFSAVTSINVTGQPGSHYISLQADPATGISPLELDLKINSSFEFPGAQISYSSTGQVEFLTPTEPASFKVRLTGGGIYTFTVYVTYEGQTFTDTVGVKVWNQPELDAVLRDKWNGMKVALAQGDAAGASNYFALETREKYLGIFDAVKDALPAVVQGMGEISPVVYSPYQAKYRIYREQIIQGAAQTITYYIYFAVDTDGLWKIFRF